MTEINMKLLTLCVGELKSVHKKITDELKRVYPKDLTVYVFIHPNQKKPTKATVTGSYTLYGEVNVLLDDARLYRARRSVHFTRIQKNDDLREIKS